ncbi:hypothetical protein GCM10027079_22890 [Sediminivirga luteola]|uniref:HTH-like domain-containing protein n=1 Tax=Sediminivirga luteola TaxID=1774748 RepID=A0A8J2U1G7_9MICO|nr:hypothetical protein GCM10011333_34730 [Sediminivirga luteola]
MLREAGMQVAASTYYAARNRPPSARAVRDRELIPKLQQIHGQNYGVYGARKLWKAAQRAGVSIGRDQTTRLMRAAGLEGVQRQKKVRTTKADATAARHPDLVNRQFTAVAPDSAVGH